MRLGVAAALLVGAPAAIAGGAGTPAPEQGVRVVLEPAGGRVLLRPPGAASYHRLAGREAAPVGSTIDARHGSVRVIVARDGAGHTWRAVFSEGRFTADQERTGDPVTTIKLRGGRFAATCAAATASKRKPKRVRRLWGDGHGRFRTAGHYSAATVRGTRWLTEDRCDGTLTKVARGVVEVEDFGLPVAGGGEGGTGQPPAAPSPATGTVVVVPAGSSYVAHPGS
jgi:hypothetical protein